MRKTRWTTWAMCALLLAAMVAQAPEAGAREVGEPVISVDGQDFYTWGDYARSEIFRERGLRCATPTPEIREMLYGTAEGGSSADCSANNTTINAAYDPTEIRTINVVFHVLRADNCTTGNVTDALINSQIDILNEDFLALAGTNGEDGTDAQIQFQLATADPDGDPTTGITRHCNTTWYNDGGTYWNTLAWDPNRYMNVYTNQASGALGYVPFLPADGGGSQVGLAHDRVVLLWSAVGRDAPFGPPYDQGRTGTHEVGHYLGLEHTFNGGCSSATPPACYTSGDLICDTNSESSPTFGCSDSGSCGSPDPIENYMDYTDDLCMELFTPEQVNRNRCTLTHYRDELATNVIFTDGFETGDTTGWDADVP